jgi:hypothetical protein
VTLAIDNAPTTTEQVTGIAAYRYDETLSKFVPASQTGTGECPAYDVGPKGYVAISTTVTDTNGHLYEYYVDAQYGHGSEVGVADPGTRGYRANPLVSATGGVCGAGDPDYGCKGWVGGSDVAYFPWDASWANRTTSPTNGLPFNPFSLPPNLPPDCCYEFRLRLAKRVTNGYSSPSLGDGDFQLISLKFSS